MSDIFCARCGEAWDSTGGLHYSHTVLDARDHALLLAGSGCPCCAENLKDLAESCLVEEMNLVAYGPEFIQRWRKSIQHLSEGEYEFCYVDTEQEPERVPIENLMERYEGREW